MSAHVIFTPEDNLVPLLESALNRIQKDLEELFSNREELRRNLVEKKRNTRSKGFWIKLLKIKDLSDDQYFVDVLADHYGTINRGPLDDHNEMINARRKQVSEYARILFAAKEKRTIMIDIDTYDRICILAKMENR